MLDFVAIYTSERKTRYLQHRMDEIFFIFSLTFDYIWEMFFKSYFRGARKFYEFS